MVGASDGFCAGASSEEEVGIRFFEGVEEERELVRWRLAGRRLGKWAVVSYK